jgi:hypothetical protein
MSQTQINTTIDQRNGDVYIRKIDLISVLYDEALIVNTDAEKKYIFDLIYRLKNMSRS